MSHSYQTLSLILFVAKHTHPCDRARNEKVKKYAHSREQTKLALPIKKHFDLLTLEATFLIFAYSLNASIYRKGVSMHAMKVMP
jgi:hypothetical protein